MKSRCFIVFDEGDKIGLDASDNLVAPQVLLPDNEVQQGMYIQ